MDENSNKLDLAARAGWLYYVAGNKQDEVAQKLKISRQTAQRLISLALEEKLVKIRIDHHMTDCMQASQQLIDQFGLKYCDVTPSDPDAPGLITGVAIVGAAKIEQILAENTPQIIAFGTGRTLRACVEHVPRMDSSHHHIVSMVGNLAMDGSATSFDTVVRLAGRVKARHNPLPLTVYVRAPEDRAILHSLEPVRNTLNLSASADVTFVGIGQIGTDAAVLKDGLLNQHDVRALEKMGAVGEIIGWSYDADGNLIDGLSNARCTSAPLVSAPDNLVIGLALGQSKIPAILGALRGKLINGLITDELTAAMIMKAI